MDISDYGRNQDLLMSFKKSCGDTIKFAAKNIPFALIQVSFITVEFQHFLSFLQLKIRPLRLPFIHSG